MDAALYWTIWIALTLFAAGEAGKRISRDGRVPARWAWPVSAAGAALLIVHIAIAMGARHGWSHAAAWSATAQQTASVYGLAWGGGVYVNYAFVALWLIELWQWHRSPERNAQRLRRRDVGDSALLRRHHLQCGHRLRRWLAPRDRGAHSRRS